ncbi:hypothetical protein [Sediminibacillus albus]|uniref:Uridine kinase n=1 Tax=Sediminibacillus albus TaxID=407036 RepID=A0A1G8WMI0_9BACI|nr:hypothetical protein [Sediminibacillus albus]SDJ79371.1 Uridine kinase [Sediminibacillus albus]
MRGKPVVIAIAAISGGGKTTTTKMLSRQLTNAHALYFDDYAFEEQPENLAEWVKEGSDYNAWELSPLVNDVKKLLEVPYTYKYILLDYPFAYQNSGMKDLIDLAIFIDTPLDIAMARRILRGKSKQTSEDIENDLSYYLSHGRAAFIQMACSIKPDSDIVIDGSMPRGLIVEQIVKELKDRKLYKKGPPK